MNFSLDWQRCKEATEAALDARLPPSEQPPQRLHEAMRYAVMNGGKRFRAILVIMTGEMLNVETKALIAPAAAIECLHAYSLVHDDLPCMDDDAYRRGKPSCHVAYDEATAVLVGDALLTLAFEILSNDKDLINFQNNKADLVAVLARGAGTKGMVGGQMMDIELENSGQILDHLDTVHRLKTARLIQAAVRLGAVMSREIDQQKMQILSEYGESVGLAFQYTDDFLDNEHDDGQLQEKGEYHRDKALAALAQLDCNTSNLRHIANFVVERSF